MQRVHTRRRPATEVARDLLLYGAELHLCGTHASVMGSAPEWLVTEAVDRALDLLALAQEWETAELTSADPAVAAAVSLAARIACTLASPTVPLRHPVDDQNSEPGCQKL